MKRKEKPKNISSNYLVVGPKLYDLLKEKGLIDNNGKIIWKIH